MTSRWSALSRFAAAIALSVALWSAPGSAHAEEGEPAGWATDQATSRIVIGRAILYYEPHLHDEAMELARNIPTWWNEVEQSMADDLDDRMQIWFFDHAGRVAEASGMPKWVAGVAHSSTGEIMIARHGPDGSPTNLESLLKHEMAHVALNRATAGAEVPRWFHEGMAESFEGGISFARSQTLAGAVFGRGVPDFDTLEEMFHGEGQDVAAAYAASRDFVNFLRDRDGKGEELQQLLRELRNGHAFKASFIRAYGFGLEELGMEWREGLPGRYLWYPLLAGGTLPFALVFPLIFVAWFRKRRLVKAGYARLEREDNEYYALPPAAPGAFAIHN
jgi:hypothetical protein